jgi:hypothetical protein
MGLDYTGLLLSADHHIFQNMETVFFIRRGKTESSQIVSNSLEELFLYTNFVSITEILMNLGTKF